MGLRLVGGVVVVLGWEEGGGFCGLGVFDVEVFLLVVAPAWDRLAVGGHDVVWIVGRSRFMESVGATSGQGQFVESRG